MRRGALLVLLAAVILAVSLSSPASASITWRERHAGVRWQTWLYPRDGFTYREVVRVVTNAAGRLGVDPAKALAVADCESGLWPAAVSSSGTFRGLFQHHAGYWPGRVAGYRSNFGATHPRLQIRAGASILHPRPNALVAMWMVAGGGWSPWTCA